MDMDEREKAIWDLYYVGVVGWQLHPGYARENVEPLTLNECAELTNNMIKVRRQHICSD